MKTCYIYARTATITQQKLTNGHSEAINNQIRICQDYAKKHRYKVLGVFTDIGISGNTLRRIDLQRLLASCKKHSPTVVIVPRIDRISRNVADFVKINKRFKEKDIKLISVAEGKLSTSNLVANIIVSVAQWEQERSRLK